jgi:excisionase family DNA binding protein
MSIHSQAAGRRLSGSRSKTGMEKLLTIREVAERLSISTGTAYHWLSAGRLTCIRFSARCVRFRESDIEDLVNELTHTAEEDPE